MYRVEILTAEGYEKNFDTDILVNAEERCQDLAAAGYNGRLLLGEFNGKGKFIVSEVVSEWTLD